MPPGPPRPDLVIVGGLTIDRFDDGRTAPGGSVIHAGLAAASAGAGLVTVTVCGDETEALAGLSTLERMGPVVRQAAPRSVTYAHHEENGTRILVLQSGCEPISEATIDRAPEARVALLAPIADELPPATIDRVRRVIAPQRVVLLIQGWLRLLRPGAAVAPLALDALAPDAVAAFATADAVVVSTDDLSEAPGDPFAQAAMLRRLLGERPLVVVTLGTEGFLLDDPAEERVVASVPRRIVRDVPTVGAGDTFGAALALALADGEPSPTAAQAGADAVIAMLDSRRR